MYLFENICWFASLKKTIKKERKTKKKKERLDVQNYIYE